MELLTAKDLKVFDIPGFKDRMEALASRIRPSLTSIGEGLAPDLSRLVDLELYPHVARHARRTVNPPDDTWVAFGADKRGYKKDVHFKIAVSRNCVRLLFEVGPEYYDKTEWAAEWRREVGALHQAWSKNRRLAWFRDEHDEAPAERLGALGADELTVLGQQLVSRRDGQIVLGRRLDRDEFLGMTPAAFRGTVQRTFKPLAPLFTLHTSRAAA